VLHHRGVTSEKQWRLERKLLLPMGIKNAREQYTDILCRETNSVTYSVQQLFIRTCWLQIKPADTIRVLQLAARPPRLLRRTLWAHAKTPAGNFKLVRTTEKSEKLPKYRSNSDNRNEIHHSPSLSTREFWWACLTHVRRHMPSTWCNFGSEWSASTEGVWEQGVDENIWTEERGSDRRLEKTS
jgi:hypothetical protein